MGHMSLGREGKAHDRRTLRGNLAKANPFAKASESSAPSRSALAQRLALPRRAGSMIDAGAFLLSRALSRDQSRMLARAADAGVAGLADQIEGADRIGLAHVETGGQPLAFESHQADDGFHRARAT